jgi:hypothetical protein
MGSQDLLSLWERWTLPVFADWNQDGLLDALYASAKGFQVHPQQDSLQFDSSQVQFVEIEEELLSLWESEDDDELSTEVEWQDLAGDGKLQMVWTRRKAEESEHILLVVPSKAGELQSPTARLKLEALQVDYRFADVDGDGLLDVVAWTFDIPRNLTALAGIHVDLSLLVFPGQSGNKVARKPVLRFERTLHPDKMDRIAESLTLDLSGDFNGDGYKDLLYLRPDGLLQIFALDCGSDDWELAEEPFASYQPTSSARKVESLDLGIDAVADLVLIHKDSLTLFGSRPSGS